MGNAYHLYPKLPKNIRQVGERDSVMKLYVEDYVNTYLKRLRPSGGRAWRAGLLLGEMRTEEGVPFAFVDGALEFTEAEEAGEQLQITDGDWKRAYRSMEQSFPKKQVAGWFVCGAPGSEQNPFAFSRLHGQYFSGRNQVLYLSGGPESGDAVYVASEEGFYRLRGYCIYYERNQLMQDYMVSRKDARRVESGVRDGVTRDFRQKMGDRQVAARRQTAVSGVLGKACGALTVAVLAGGFVLFGNYRRMKEMEAVIASVMPEGGAGTWTDNLLDSADGEDGLVVEEIPGNVYPVPEISIKQAQAETAAASAEELLGESYASAGETAAPENGSGAQMAAAGEADDSGAAAGAADVQAVSVPIPENAVPYVVQEGETLYGICLSRYHSLSRLDEICAINRLEDQDHIRAGQELYLPAE